MGLTRGGIITVVIVAVVVGGMSLLLGTWWTLGIILTLTAVLALTLLIAAKTPFGRRIAGKVGRRLAPTRLGRRLAHTQLRAEAKRRGVSLTDPTGRALSDVELQLELLDTPETRAIKRQLRTMNPQQRAQALRMLENQAAEAARGNAPPQAVPTSFPQQRVSGRPVTRPPRASRKRRKR